MAPRKKTQRTGKKKSAKRTNRFKTTKPRKKSGLLNYLLTLVRFKSAKRKKDKQKVLLLIGSLGILLLIVLPFIFFKKVSNKPQLLSVSPIAHLIASLSAQNKPILIDPEFSYKDQPAKAQEIPERIIIPSLNIDLPVVKAPVIDGFWETSTNSASFGMGSANPGQTGNTVIFAHALPALFGNLGNIQKEAPIYVLTKSGWYAYKVNELKVVLPTTIEVISPTPDKTLTLYTCSGYGDVYRFVVIAKKTE